MANTHIKYKQYIVITMRWCTLNSMVQAKVMMFMPLIFSVMFFFFPAGLVLYWLVNNIFSIAQQWFITYQTEQAALKKPR